MKKQLVFWGEKYLFFPGVFEKLLSFLLLPFSLLYCCIVWFKFKTAKIKDYGIPIVSIGNLIVGGSGKTPLTVALASRYKKSAIVLRGYGRASKGLYLVSDTKNILYDVKVSGDEAMLYATLLPQSFVIVSEDRIEGIKKAKEMGCEIVFLDDAYSKHFIKKLDLLILTKQSNNFCLPSGPYRERLWKGKEAMTVQEGRDFTRKVSISNEQKKMVLVTAISKPHRLDPYLIGKVIDKVYFPDHYSFKKKELEEILLAFKADSLLVTHKDAVKMKDFDLPLSFLDLELEVNKEIHDKVQEYVRISSSNK
ncbi:MAG: tetraacyldisaccharide 4'-kinase [Arcobacter sp.]|nr:MAG: tetraacyldisaccharide 4'-kinase [Arcobacter sp.]